MEESQVLKMIQNIPKVRVLISPKVWYFLIYQYNKKYDSY